MKEIGFIVRMISRRNPKIRNDIELTDDSLITILEYVDIKEQFEFAKCNKETFKKCTTVFPIELADMFYVKTLNLEDITKIFGLKCAGCDKNFLKQCKTCSKISDATEFENCKKCPKEHDYCKSCVRKCNYCSETYCKEHNSLIKCGNCAKQYCKKCIKTQSQRCKCGRLGCGQCYAKCHCEVFACKKCVPITCTCNQRSVCVQCSLFACDICKRKCCENGSKVKTCVCSKTKPIRVCKQCKHTCHENVEFKMPEIELDE